MLKNFFILVLVVVLALPGCAMEKQGEEKNYTARDELLGTEVIITVEANKEASEACDEIFSRIKQIEEKMTTRNPNSEIFNLNANAGNKEITLSKDTYHVLKEAVAFSNMTGGAFDPTIGPLVKLWGFDSRDLKVPPDESIERKLTLVDYRLLELENNKETFTAMLQRDGQAVDLGGIAKGYAGDEAKRILLNHGIKRGIINLGGNIIAVGTKEDGIPWRIGIQNPMAPRGTFLGILELADKAVVTSGGYERSFVAAGKRYHHIIDPQTGYPSESGLLSVTIISERGLVSDALSTGVFVMGLHKGMELIESLKGIEAVFVTGDKKVFVTKEIQDMFQLTDSKFSYEKHK